MPKRRIMLKLSGEALAKEGKFGINHERLLAVAKQIKEARTPDVELAIVLGGGNIWRYRDTTDSGIERTTSDAMGMLATIMNSVALQAALESLGLFTRVASAIDVPQLAEPYIRRRVIRHLEKGRIVICAGGTGNPYFTTDSAAALRSLELGCSILLKATDVEGIYNSDPRKNKEAKLYKTLTHQEAIEGQLDVMDQAAFSLCRDSKLPIRVFDFFRAGNLCKAMEGKEVGTLVRD